MITVNQIMYALGCNKQPALAKKLDLSVSKINYWRTKVFHPRFSDVQKIVKLSNGKLKYEDFEE